MCYISKGDVNYPHTPVFYKVYKFSGNSKKASLPAGHYLMRPAFLRFSAAFLFLAGKTSSVVTEDKYFTSSSLCSFMDFLGAVACIIIES